MVRSIVMKWILMALLITVEAAHNGHQKRNHNVDEMKPNTPLLAQNLPALNESPTELESHALEQNIQLLLGDLPSQERILSPPNLEQPNPTAVSEPFPVIVEQPSDQKTLLVQQMSIQQQEQYPFVQETQPRLSESFYQVQEQQARLLVVTSPSTPQLLKNPDETKTPYTPDWKSLDARPLPSWYDDAKVGIFIHWGVFSVPSFISEWFWMYWKGDPTPNKHYQKLIDNFMKSNYKPRFSYQDFARDFTAEFFDAALWADIIENSGARYVILTSKHHEGYTLWPSKYSPNWNSEDVGPHRDIVGELRNAIVKKKQIKFGLYHSLYEWFNPLYLADKASNFTQQHFVNNKIILEMKELVSNYKPDVFWSDGEEEAPSEYWKSQEFLAWLYNDSPVKKTVVVNDRWGTGTACKHGGTFTCQDRYNPGSLQNHKWENAMSLDSTTWGFNRVSNLENYLTSQELIDEIASTVACGGNIVMNIGPAQDGTISPIFQDRLNEVGKWLKINGESIYGSKPWNTCQNDTMTPNIWYTTDISGNDLFVLMLRWPQSGILQLECPKLTTQLKISMLGLPHIQLDATTVGNYTEVILPSKVAAPTNWGSVLKMENFKDENRPTPKPTNGIHEQEFKNELRTTET